MISGPRSIWLGVLSAAVVLVGVAIAWRVRPAPPPDLGIAPEVQALDRALDWSRARLIAVQDAQRYKTLDSLAREEFAAMHGAEHLPGLSPLASLFEWLFNRDQYRDLPVVRIKDIGIRRHITRAFKPERRSQIIAGSYMTLNELALPAVGERLNELEPRFEMRPAMIRTRNAQFTAERLGRMLALVPQQIGTVDTPWLSPEELIAFLPAEQRGRLGPTPPVRPGIGPDAITTESATQVLIPWASLRAAWLARDAARVQEMLDRLTTLLPELAPAGVYPSEMQRRAEARYYAMGKFTWGWLAYFVGAIAAFWCLVTGWRWAFVAAQVLLLAGMAVHGYGVALRWEILGHVPVANMFEAITGSSLLCLTLLLGIELTDRFRRLPAAVRNALIGGYVLVAVGVAWLLTANIWFKPGAVRSGYDSPSLTGVTFVVLAGYAYLLISSLRGLPHMLHRPQIRPVFLMAANVAGFFALVIAGYVVPGGGTLTSIKGILDDVMLRVHTILIISSYALIFVAAVIALVYIFGYYFNRAPAHSEVAGLAVGFAGGMLWVASAMLFDDQLTKLPYAALVSAIGAAGAFAALALLAAQRAAGENLMLSAILVLTLTTIWIGSHGFVQVMGYVMLEGGLIWALLNAIGQALQPARAGARSASAASAPADARQLAFQGLPSLMSAPELWQARPLLAGGAPGDEPKGAKLPAWLHTMDWSHLIILNMVFIMLFVGTVLGAVWADYSWGRPWGWDPKEVFALNTWLVYAVLIHSRFAAREKGIWTAWLSIVGCLMMVFNWCFVNFYIVGLHSYA